MKYFEVATDDQNYGDRWFLDEPRTKTRKVIDARSFTATHEYTGPEPAIVPIQQRGVKVHFNMAACDMPVVSNLVWKTMKPLVGADTRFYPVLIGPDITDFGILHVLCSENCVDENRTEVQRWTASDGRPELIGKYLGITNLTIHPDLANGKHIFRIKGWEVALIVSEQLMKLLSKIQNLGIKFIPVC